MNRSVRTLRQRRVSEGRPVGCSAVARPFRFEPPAPPAGECQGRGCSMSLLVAGSTDLVTVVAGPRLREDIAAGRSHGARPRRRERAATSGFHARPQTPRRDHLGRGLAEAMALDDNTSIDAIFDFVWARAPTPITVMLDDVHTIAAGSEGALAAGSAGRRATWQCPRRDGVARCGTGVGESAGGRGSAMRLAGTMTSCSTTGDGGIRIGPRGRAEPAGLDGRLAGSGRVDCECRVGFGHRLPWDEVLGTARERPGPSPGSVCDHGRRRRPTLRRRCRRSVSFADELIAGLPLVLRSATGSRRCTRCGLPRCASS